MSKDAFETFFEKLKQEKLDVGDGSWEYAESPYLV